MASHLAKIHGTEEDKVNCPFYYKIGACRHGDRCSRLHHKPAFSQTLLIRHLYQHPDQQEQAAAGTTTQEAKVDPEQALEDYLCFFEDLYAEFSKFGRVEELHVADNVGDHIVGHVYVKFQDEEQAADALQVMQGRYYDGRPLQMEYSPVTDFREARCRDYDETSCKRGGFCNFLHVKPVPPPLVRSLEEDCEMDRRRHEEEMEEEERRSHSRDRKKKRKKEHKRHRSSKSRSRSRDREGRDSGSEESDGGGGSADEDDEKEKDRRHHQRSRRSSRHRDGEDEGSHKDDDKGGGSPSVGSNKDENDDKDDVDSGRRKSSRKKRRHGDDDHADDNNNDDSEKEDKKKKKKSRKG